VARPTRFELVTSAFGELWTIQQSSYFCGFSV